MLEEIDKNDFLEINVIIPSARKLIAVIVSDILLEADET